MLIEIAHVNGTYSPESGVHTAPSTLPEGYYSTLASITMCAIDRGVEVLYRPNFTSFTHNIFSGSELLKCALASDPFLYTLGNIDALTVQPDDIGRPLDYNAREDELLRKCSSARGLSECMRPRRRI